MKSYKLAEIYDRDDFLEVKALRIVRALCCDECDPRDDQKKVDLLKQILESEYIRGRWAKDRS
jgi:hypothetical protein